VIGTTAKATLLEEALWRLAEHTPATAELMRLPVPRPGTLFA
jgi:hypothetical protein